MDLLLGSETCFSTSGAVVALDLYVGIDAARCEKYG